MENKGSFQNRLPRTARQLREIPATFPERGAAEPRFDAQRRSGLPVDRHPARRIVLRRPRETDAGGAGEDGALFADALPERVERLSMRCATRAHVEPVIAREKRRRFVMAETALMVAIAALILSGVAYFRAGGRRDVERAVAQLRSELEALRAREKELVQNVQESIRSAFEETRERILRARARLADLEKQAIAGLEKQVALASDQLRRLEQRLEQQVMELGRQALSAAQSAESSLSRRARQLEARVELLRIKAEALAAKAFAEKQEFDRADVLLHRAVTSLEDARTMLGRDDALASELEDVARSLRDAITATRSRAEDLRRRIDKVITDSDSLVAALSELEDDSEREASLEASTPAASARGPVRIPARGEEIGSGPAQHR
jgi:DNA repair exonuclease SbcCD ATPase subunit